MVFKKCIFVFLLFFGHLIFAQKLGQHDQNIDWHAFETPYVKIIFPKENKKQAFRIANIINDLHTIKNLKPFLKKTPIILQNQQSISNGFVTMFPFRSEFFLRASQPFNRMGTGNWIDLLTIHEYQHILQFQKAKTGITKFLYYVFGENGWGLGTGMNLPHWYFEGDAVLSETLHSKSGRGRVPYFFALQKALALENVFYDYNKARNGSFKDWVPSVYPLGYVMMEYLHQHFSDKKAKILKDAHKYKFIFYPFSNAIKKHTGYSTKNLYEKSYENLKIKWQKEIQNKKISETQNIINEKNKVVTHYTFPHFLEDGSWVAIKKSFTQTPHLVHIKNGKTKKIIDLDIAPQEFLSVQKNWLLWTALRRDLRYGNKNYSVIMGYDLKTKKKKQFTSKTHFYAPALSLDLKKIACVHAQNNGHYNICILDVASGKILKILKNSEQDFISLPKWKNDNTLIFLAQRNQKIAFFSYDLKTKKKKQLSDWTYKTIGNYCIGKEYLYCSAGFEGSDAIYALHLKNKTFKEVAITKIGAYTPCVNKNETLCVFSDFTKDGQKLKQVNIHFKNKNIPNISKTFFNLKNNKNHIPILDSLSNKKYEIKNYKGFFKDFRIYNWGLQLDNTRPKIEDLSLGFNAGNPLRNLAINGAVRYNRIEENVTSDLKINYQKYPITFGMHFSKGRRNYTKFQENAIFLFPQENHFSQTKISLNFGLPLSRITGNYYQSFHLKNDYSYRFISPQNFKKAPENFAAYGFQIQLKNIRRKAHQNIASKFSQQVYFDFQKSFQENIAHRISLYTVFSFPGLFVNDSFSVAYFWKNQPHNQKYLFKDYIAYARGYEALIQESLQNISLEYHMPLWYPDWGFAGIFYLKRWHANFFYDHTILKAKFYKDDFEFNSVGVENFMDVNFLNILPFTLGVRHSLKLKEYPKNNKDYSVDFLIRLRL